MNDAYLRYIEGVARLERKIRALEEGDFVRVSARWGDFAGCVESIEDVKNRHVVTIDADVFNGDAMEAETHTLYIDRDGMKLELPFHVPYIGASADLLRLGEVQDLYTERRAAA